MNSCLINRVLSAFKIKSYSVFEWGNIIHKLEGKLKFHKVFVIFTALYFRWSFCLLIQKAKFETFFIKKTSSEFRKDGFKI